MKIAAPLLLVALALAGCETTPAPPAGVTLYQIKFSGKFYELDQVEVKPRATHQTAPRYPRGLRMQTTGKAVIALIVEKDGSTSEVQVAAATGREFGEAAQAAVEQWRFLPGRRNGAPVRVRLELPILFTTDN